MAGKKGMHTRVLNAAAVDRIRERIKADRIIKSLEDHVLTGKEMTPSQVSAGLGLLKKRVPDLAAVEVSGPQGGPIQQEHAVRPTMNPEDWLKLHGLGSAGRPAK